MSQHPTSDAARRNRTLALVLTGVFAGMVGLSFAAVPLYRVFCQATGFGGVTQTARAAPTPVAGTHVTVRFDANVRGLSWTFEPAQLSQTAELGETKLAFYRATNTGKVPLTGRAVHNVVPTTAGIYFTKLECFCFKSQTIQPGQTVEFPVVYFIDPRFAKDPETRGQPEVTLSYTFYPAKPAQTAEAKPVSPLGGAARAGL